jgi:hypothetical protein
VKRYLDQTRAGKNGRWYTLTPEERRAQRIGHWDVPEMREVLAEAWELVDDGLLSEADFRDLSFTNAVKLHGGMNPRLFEGTVVEAQATRVLGA